jgi:hypothetical protein
VEHPWENGRAERSFQTIFTKARSMMKFADLPIGKPFDFTSLRLFGSPAQIFIRPSVRASNKFSNRSEHGTLLGMSSKGNGYIFRVDRNHTIVEVDSKDVKFNETFSDIRDHKGRLIRRGVVLPPDLHTTREPDATEPESAESDLPSQDGIIATTKRSPIPTSNRYQALSDPVDSSLDDSPSTTQGPKEPTSAPDRSQRPSIPKATKHWQYVPDGAHTGTGDRKNDGPKSVSFFQVPPAIQGPERRSTRINAQATIKPTTPATVLTLKAPDYAQIVCIKNFNNSASLNSKLINVLMLNGIIGTPLASQQTRQSLSFWFTLMTLFLLPTTTLIFRILKSSSCKRSMVWIKGT